MKRSNSTYYRQIWDTVAVVPRGKVASYGQIADLAGLPRRARMVSRAMQAAPVELKLPWYRILRSSGEIAFARGSAAADRQQQTLLEEGVVVRHHRVDLACFGWKPDLVDMLARLKY